jgi:guanine deaminase
MFLKRLGLLSPRLNIAHSIWIAPEEVDLLAVHGANVVLNPVSNLKTRGGVAPIPEFLRRNVNVGLGCDNCSCSDTQNMFQAMKLFSTLATLHDPEPGRPVAQDALRAAILGGATTAGLENKIGKIQVGMAADLTIIDLTDPTFVPLNSAARQIVFGESGRAVETVIVDGRIVVKDCAGLTVDEKGLREEIAGFLMTVLRKDLGAVLEQNRGLMPYLLEAYNKTVSADLGIYRHIGN